MIYSMTGFGGAQIKVSGVGSFSVELRSTNHKFLEAVLHLPQGFLFLEEVLKKEIESKIKRGRIVCAISIVGKPALSVAVNKGLLKKYLNAIAELKSLYPAKENPRIDTIMNLPGVFALEEAVLPKDKAWPHLKRAVDKALAELILARRKEGQVLVALLKKNQQLLKRELDAINLRYKKTVKDKCAFLSSDEERSSFLKDSDITEEIERLQFHVKNLQHKLAKASPIGKELDFIAQEMQREANTMGAKCCDTDTSARVIQLKSEIEKIREQVQNIE